MHLPPYATECWISPRKRRFESAEYEGMVDFHWRFDTWADGEPVATALSALSDRPEVVLLRLTNFDDLDASITFKDVRCVKH